VKLLLDENLAPAHAARLRRAGHDAVALLEPGWLLSQAEFVFADAGESATNARRR
jgi:hypothetical protein